MMTGKLRRCGLPLLPLLLLVMGFTMPSAPALGQDGGDRLVSAHGSDLFGVDLPRGTFEELAQIQDPPDAMAYGPDGRLYALGLHTLPITAPPFLALYIIGDTGESDVLTEVEISFFEGIEDMAFDPGGRLWVLISGIGVGDPPQPAQILYRLDLEGGEILDFHFVPDQVSFIATAPRGLWLIEPERLLHFDSATGATKDSGLPFGPWDQLTTLAGAATDSTGALWMIFAPIIIDPAASAVVRFDPATGATLGNAPITLPFGPLAIEQRCHSSGDSRCLLGGRFQAAVEWRDFENRTGHGQVAASGSADSALFYFFDPSNWELLVKVIDGCDENGHFWVFAAGTTNVEHTLEVTDLLTGEVFAATNPLGQASEAVTETRAFATCDP